MTIMRFTNAHSYGHSDGSLVLVLPAHGDPFIGLHSRIEPLIDGHESVLKNLTEALNEPRLVIDLFEVMFHRPIKAEAVFLAVRGRGLAHSDLDESGVSWWLAGASESEAINSSAESRPDR